MKLQKLLNKLDELTLVTDKKQAALLNEFAELKSEMAKIKKEMDAKMKPFADRAKELDSPLRAIFDELDETQLKTEKALVKLSRGKENVENPSYKGLWEAALVKVNKATRNVLEDLYDEMLKFKNIPNRWTASLMGEAVIDEGILDQIKGFFKKAYAKFKSILGGAKKANKAADDLLKLADKA